MAAPAASPVGKVKHLRKGKLKNESVEYLRFFVPRLQNLLCGFPIQQSVKISFIVWGTLYCFHAEKIARRVDTISRKKDENTLPLKTAFPHLL